MGLMDISVLIVAIAFCFLVYYLIKVLKSMNQSLMQTEQTIARIQEQVDELGKETTVLLQHTNEVVKDLDKKSKSLDPIFLTVQEAGEAVHQLSSSALEATSTLSQNVKAGIKQSASRDQDTYARVLRGLSLGYFLVQKWKQRKHAKQNAHNK